MDVGPKREALKEKQEAAKIQFIVTELDLAHTFCKIAASADDEVQRRRNRAKARKAYDTALHFLAGATPTPETRQVIDNKVKRLRSLLRSLGEAPGRT
jgi:hypothetical protein